MTAGEFLELNDAIYKAQAAAGAVVVMAQRCQLGGVMDDAAQARDVLGRGIERLTHMQHEERKQREMALAVR